jgi:hypothetical protein
MAKAIRVSDGKKWAYVPASREHQARLESFAAAGLAEIINGVVELRADAGPMFWELIKVHNKPVDITQQKIALDCVGDKSININPDEELSFGEKEGALAYSKSADLSLSKQSWPQDGIKLAVSHLEEGQIVMTLWPESKRLIPARAISGGKRFSLELVESQSKGERCFILDDKCNSLLTVSFPSDGSDKVMAINPIVMDSWLVAAGSEAMLKLSGRFSVKDHAEGMFIIADSKSGKGYSGKYVFNPSDNHNFEIEKTRMERLLASKGLGAILPTYKLKRA